MITARPIAVAADAQTKVYGNADPALTYRITSGSLVSGDTFSGALARVTGETVDRIRSRWERWRCPTTTHSRSRRRISDHRATHYRDGRLGDEDPRGRDPVLTYLITSGSLVNGDSFSGSLSRVAGEGVGSYGIGQGSLALSSNYSLTFIAAKLSIQYRLDPFQPINDTAHQISVALSKFKLGQTIPAKFVIRNAAGLIVQQAGDPTLPWPLTREPVTVALMDEAPLPEAADNLPVYRWDGPVPLQLEHQGLWRGWVSDLREPRRWHQPGS